MHVWFSKDEENLQMEGLSAIQSEMAQSETAQSAWHLQRAHVTGWRGSSWLQRAWAAVLPRSLGGCAPKEVYIILNI